MTTKAKKGAAITEAFVMHTRSMLMSPAWRTLNLAARRVLDRIEIEMMNKGGPEPSNGRLVVTYDMFEKHGVHRHAIKPALAELEALGFIVKTVEGRGGNAAHRKANQFRLTSYKFKENGTVYYEPTREWRRIKTMEQAEAIVEPIRNDPTHPTAKRAKRQRQRETFPSGGIRTTPVAESALQNGGSQWRNPHCSPVADSATTYNIFHPMFLGDAPTTPAEEATPARQPAEAEPAAAPAEGQRQMVAVERDTEEHVNGTMGDKIDPAGDKTDPRHSVLITDNPLGAPPALHGGGDVDDYAHGYGQDDDDERRRYEEGDDDGYDDDDDDDDDGDRGGPYGTDRGTYGGGDRPTPAIAAPPAPLPAPAAPPAPAPVDQPAPASTAADEPEDDYTSPDGIVHFTGAEIAELQRAAYTSRRVTSSIMTLAEGLPGFIREVPLPERKDKIRTTILEWHNNELRRRGLNGGTANDGKQDAGDNGAPTGG